jgi:hypothetical protein
MTPPISRLAYLIMKTERAKMHLDSLNRELAIFSKEPYTVITKEDTQNSRYIRRTQFKSIDPIIGMLCGEFLYCLRSGLDQLAWQIALPSARRDCPNLVCFPIYESITGGQDRRNFAKAMAWFPENVATEIRALQPHNGPGPVQDHPLWQLNKLCNIDKHCVIPINSRSANIFIPCNPAVCVSHLDSEDAIEVSVPLCDKSQLDFEPDFVFPIEFGEWNSDLRIPREKLSEIQSFIECTVIPKFSKLASDRSVEMPFIRMSNIKTICQ